jgi:polyisoprenoid-binding protein YceI
MKLFQTAVLAAALAAPSFALAADYEIDSAHSSAAFAVKHMVVSTVRGSFGKVTGSVNVDEKDITRSTVEATIDVSTINTNEAKRDAHLKNADFFDVARYPTITFKSKSVKKAGEGLLKVTGDLTMHGVTKEVTLDVEGPAKEVKDLWGATKSGVAATTRLNRKDFGLGWNKVLETGGVAVGEEVAITIDLELTKKAPAAKATAKDGK